jgi:uncharacterized protein YjgD (DUF1641 family)
MSDEIVKVKRDDLERLVNNSIEAYNLLDEAGSDLSDVANKLRKAYNALEDSPPEMSDIIVKDDEVTEEEK